MHTSQKSYHNCILEKRSWALFSLSFGNDSDDEIATEQLTTVVDVTFVPHGNQKYPNSLDSHEIH